MLKILRLTVPFLLIDERRELFRAYVALNRSINTKKCHLTPRWYLDDDRFDLFGDQPLPLTERVIEDACAFSKDRKKHMVYDGFFYFYTRVMAYCHPDEELRYHICRVFHVSWCGSRTHYKFTTLELKVQWPSCINVTYGGINGGNTTTMDLQSDLAIQDFSTMLGFIELEQGYEAWLKIWLFVIEPEAIAFANRFYELCLRHHKDRMAWAVIVHHPSPGDNITDSYPWCKPDQGFSLHTICGAR